MSPKMRRRPSSRDILLLLVLLLQREPSVEASSAHPTSPSSSFGNDLRDWIQARCGSGNNDAKNNMDDSVALWVYEGALFDPLEGRKIANVEGVELVRCVASTNRGDDTHSNAQAKHWGELEVGPLLRHPNATYDHASTILSRKLFCYQSPENPAKLLSTIRLRPNAPLRKIPTKQAVAVYDTATTFIARGQELLAHTEWPDHQSIWGRAARKSSNINQDGDEDTVQQKKKITNNHQQSASKSTKSFDFTIYARQKSANKKTEQLFDLTTPPVVDDGSSSSVIASPRRAKLIEFGTGSSNAKDKFGARETYSYTYDNTNNKAGYGLLQRLGLRRSNDKSTSTMTPPICQVRYSRYGEGPPFFGPGRICSLELQGRRVASLDDLPPLTKSVIANRMSPLFLTPSTTFRSPSQSHALDISLADDESEDFWLPDYLKEQGRHAWNKIRGAHEKHQK